MNKNMKIIKVPGVNGLGHTEGTLNSPNLLTENLETSEIALDKNNIEEQEKKIYEESLKFLEEKTFFIGGDHSISFPIGKAFLKTYNNPYLIIFDAHADLMKPMNPATHEEWLRALIEAGFPKENITLIGIRNLDEKEEEYIKENKIKIININEIDNLINSIKDKNIYISFVIDLEDDLETLLEFTKKKNEKINLLLRMKLKENTMFSGKHYVFGLDSKKVDSLILKLKDNELIDKLGIHFHRKTQNFSEWSLIEEVESLSKESLERIDLVNIGGGLPGKYKNTDDRALKIILDEIKRFKDWFKKEVIVEPGRFIASYAIDLECNIIAKDKNTLFVNFSIFNGALDTIIANVKLLVEGEREKGEKYLIKGITPDSVDILRYEVFLDNPKVGDTIKFLNVGAYNYHSDFCSLEKVSTIVV